MCLLGADQEEQLKEDLKAKRKPQNSTHEYDKEVSLSEKEQTDMKSMKQKQIVELLESMNIDKRLADILLYAIGMINESQISDDNQVKCVDFYQRIAKYLRSIGYYGDSPFMMCNYGSSEYA